MVKPVKKLLILVVTLALASCHSVGPPTLQRDRLDYGRAIAESWKNQTLLNVIKLRYSDPPLFVDIGQIVGGYSLETTLGLVATDLVDGNQQSVNGNARFIDRPTITYVPLTGQAFLSGLVTPISPASIVTAIQVGWPAETILPIGVVSINGIRNESMLEGTFRPPDPEFERLVDLIGDLHESGDLIFRSRHEDEAQVAEMFLHKPAAGDSGSNSQLRQLLGLASDVEVFDIVFGQPVKNDGRIFINTRSILNVLQLLSSLVDIPADHIEEGRASAGASQAKNRGFEMIRILSSPAEPKDAAVAVEYRDIWFYIEDRDLKSKGTFALLMLLFTLAETSEEQNSPVLTIPTG